MATDAFRDPSLEVEARVADLLRRMTVEEKAAQTAAPFGPTVDVHSPPSTGWGSALAALSTLNLPPREAASAANELQRMHLEETRLGIPILLSEEALVGLKVRGATTFPDAIAQACTWQPDLVEEMAKSIGKSMALLGVRQALSPLADVARDPRWGRVPETYGEDPYLVGSFASAFVRGLQDADPEVPLIATLKHFIGYGASDGGRNTEPAQLGPRELREVHGRSFEMAIRTAGARAVMPAYNAVDGEAVSGSKAYLSELLRGEMGFEGLVISDLAAVSQLHTRHGTAEDPAHAVAQALAAGIDLDLDVEVGIERLVDAVRSGVVDEVDLDRAVVNVLRAKFQIGLFERPYVDVDAVPASLDSAEERSLARHIAEKSVVLLQNKPVDGERLLPLRDGLQTIAVIGPNADRPLGQLGHYSYQVLDSITQRFSLAANPQARPDETSDVEGRTGADDARLLVESVPVVTFLEGIRERAGENVSVLHEPGCPIVGDDRSGIGAAVRAASRADVAVVVVGDQAGINAYGSVGEGIDSSVCDLPGVQRDLVEAVVATGTPTVVVLSHGRPFVLGWMADQVPAIVTGFFGGEEAGNAMAAVLFGDVNPAGRLPIALLRSVGASPAPYWRPPAGPGYVDGSADALFPFGHGLSYTSFEYRDVRLDAADVPTDGVVRLSFTIANVGPRSGDEVVQVYGQDVIGRTARRGPSLVAFHRVALEAGRGARIILDIPTTHFALWDNADGWVVEPGLVKLAIGASSSAIRLRSRVTLVGDVHHPAADRPLRSTVAVAPLDETFSESPASQLNVPVYDTSAGPVSDTSTVREWLEHPVGGALLRAALGGPRFDEDALLPAHNLPLRQLVALSGGRFPQSLLDDLLERYSTSAADR